MSLVRSHRHGQDVKRRFEEYGVRLYHFTDGANCFNIQRLGAILPVRELRARSIVPNYVSDECSRRSDSWTGRDAFVHLAFHPDHKMTYVARRRSLAGLAIYEVSPRVLGRPGVTFSRGLANRQGEPQIDIQEITDADLLQIAHGLDHTRYWQLLIPGAIPLYCCRRYA